MFQTTEQASGVAPTRSQTSAHSPTLTNETQLLLCACSNIVKVSVIVGTNSVFPGGRRASTQRINARRVTIAPCAVPRSALYNTLTLRQLYH